MILGTWIFCAFCPLEFVNNKQRSQHERRRHPGLVVPLDMKRQRHREADARRRALTCVCGHRHSAGSDGEDAGCPCVDGHDWRDWRASW